MGNVLQEAAINYDRLTKTEYLYTIGTKDRSLVIFEFVGCNTEEFTHIYGLDHLDDVPEFNQLNNSSAKKRVFKKIKLGDITMDYLIDNSSKIEEPIPSTYNPETGTGFTILDRIISLKNLEEILDNAENASLYKWVQGKSRYVGPDGKKRTSNIKADYLLLIPGPIAGTNYHIFAYKERNIDPNEPERLKIHSAFLDGANLASGQGKALPILHVRKYKNRRKYYEDLYIKKGYIFDEETLGFGKKKKK